MTERWNWNGKEAALNDGELDELLSKRCDHSDILAQLALPRKHVLDDLCTVVSTPSSLTPSFVEHAFQRAMLDAMDSGLGWVVLCHPDPAIEWERELRGLSPIYGVKRVDPRSLVLFDLPPSETSLLPGCRTETA